MRNLIPWSVAIPLLFLQVGCAIRTSPAAHQFELNGNVSHAQLWTAPEFEAQFREDLTTGAATLKGREFQYVGVPLIKVINQAAPVVDPGRKNADLSLVVVVQAKDGYAVAFSLAELREEFGNARAILMTSQDGHGLAADRGPVELIVPGDKKPSRWVHGLQTIRIVQTATTR